MLGRGRLHDGQWDLGLTRERPSGVRSATTFKKLPTDAPMANMAALSTPRRLQRRDMTAYDGLDGRNSGLKRVQLESCLPLRGSWEELAPSRTLLFVDYMVGIR